MADIDWTAIQIEALQLAFKSVIAEMARAGFAEPANAARQGCLSMLHDLATDDGNDDTAKDRAFALLDAVDKLFSLGDASGPVRG